MFKKKKRAGVIFICRAPCWQRKASAGSTGQFLFTLKGRGSGMLTGVWPPPPFTEEAWLWNVDRSLTNSLNRRGMALGCWQEFDHLLLTLNRRGSGMFDRSLTTYLLSPKRRGSGMLTGVCWFHWPPPSYTEQTWLWNVDRSLTASSLHRRGVALECWQESDRLLLTLKGRGSGMLTGVWPTPPYTEEAWLWNVDRSLLVPLATSFLLWTDVALEMLTGDVHGRSRVASGVGIDSSQSWRRTVSSAPRIKWICGITIISPRTFARVTRKTHLWRQDWRWLDTMPWGRCALSTRKVWPWHCMKKMGPWHQKNCINSIAWRRCIRLIHGTTWRRWIHLAPGRCVLTFWLCVLRFDRT